MQPGNVKQQRAHASLSVVRVDEGLSHNASGSFLVLRQGIQLLFLQHGLDISQAWIHVDFSCRNRFVVRVAVSGFREQF